MKPSKQKAFPNEAARIKPKKNFTEINSKNYTPYNGADFRHRGVIGDAAAGDDAVEDGLDKLPLLEEIALQRPLLGIGMLHLLHTTRRRRLAGTSPAALHGRIRRKDRFFAAGDLGGLLCNLWHGCLHIPLVKLILQALPPALNFFTWLSVHPEPTNKEHGTEFTFRIAATDLAN